MACTATEVRSKQSKKSTPSGTSSSTSSAARPVPIVRMKLEQISAQQMRTLAEQSAVSVDIKNIVETLEQSAHHMEEKYKAEMVKRESELRAREDAFAIRIKKLTDDVAVHIHNSNAHIHNSELREIAAEARARDSKLQEAVSQRTALITSVGVMTLTAVILIPAAGFTIPVAGSILTVGGLSFTLVKSAAGVCWKRLRRCCESAPCLPLESDTTHTVALLQRPGADCVSPNADCVSPVSSPASDNREIDNKKTELSPLANILIVGPSHTTAITPSSIVEPKPAELASKRAFESTSPSPLRRVQSPLLMSGMSGTFVDPGSVNLSQTPLQGESVTSGRLREPAAAKSYKATRS